MWLDELNELVVELSTKIDQHREILRKSESATRYCLIDPLLAALGWDLSDPAQVLTEFNSGNGWADYAMAPGNGPPSLVVEAKSLFTPTAQGIAQSINYCLQDGIKYFVVTNGDDWEVYETHRPVPMQDKRVTAFKITDMSQSAVMGMLWMWRGNFKDGDPAMSTTPPPAKELPITSSAPVAPSSRPVEATPPVSAGPPIQPESGVSPAPTGTPLSELTNVTGREPPQFMTFPDGVRKSLSSWYELQVNTVEWLIESGSLSEANCPLTNSRGTHLVHTYPCRRDGKRFTVPKPVNQYWIDGNASASNHVSRTRDILDAAGVGPATVFVSSSAQASTPSSQPYSRPPAVNA